MSEYKPGSRIFAMFIGPSGNGKTVGAGSFPKPWIADCDRRIAPVALFYPKTDAEYETFGPNDFDKLAKRLEGFQYGCPYKTICVDSLTAVGDMSLNYMISFREGSAKKKGVLELPGIEDFGGEARAITQIIELARVLDDVNFIMTAHYLAVESYDVVEKRNRVEKFVLTGGKKIAAKVPAFFDETWLFQAETGLGAAAEAKYSIRTKPTNELPFLKTALPLPAKLDWTMRPGEPGLWQRIQKILEAEASVVRLK